MLWKYDIEDYQVFDVSICHGDFYETSLILAIASLHFTLQTRQKYESLF